MSSQERYADSALARQEVRRQEELAAGESRVPDYFDDPTRALSEEELEARRAADSAYKKRLAERIRCVMGQMEKICPPQGGVACAHPPSNQSSMSSSKKSALTTCAKHTDLPKHKGTTALPLSNMQSQATGVESCKSSATEPTKDPRSPNKPICSAPHGARGIAMSEKTQLAEVPPKETALQVFKAEKGLDPYLKQIRDTIDAFVPDVSTRKGRDAIASIAYSVARSKTALDNVGKELVAELKDIPKKIDAERKRMRDTLDAWQEEVRRPLTEWQAAEDARVDKHIDGIQRIKDLAMFSDSPSAAHVAQVIADLDLLPIDDSWQEFVAEAAQAKDKSLIKLRAMLTQRQEFEAEQAELARLRSEAEAREKADREAAIARAAAEQAQREADERAAAERAEAARREQALIDQAAAQQRAAEQKIRDAEAEAERQRLQIKLQAEQAERQAAQAEANRIAAEQRAEQAAEQARIDERRRADEAAAEIIRQQQARERDEAHRRSINRAALDAFIAGGMPDACAKQAVTLIAQRRIPAIAITY